MNILLKRVRIFNIVGAVLIAILIPTGCFVGEKTEQRNYAAFCRVNPEVNISYADFRTLKSARLLPGQQSRKPHKY